MQSSIQSLSAGALLLLTSSHAEAAGLLLNPGFEANVIPSATNITVTSADYESAETSPQISPWAFSGVAGYLASGGATSGFWGTSSRFASQFMVLGNFGDGQTASSIVQTFLLDTAGTYDLSFEWQTGRFSEDSSYGTSTGGTGTLSLRILNGNGDILSDTSILTDNDQQGRLSAGFVAIPAGAGALQISFDHESGGGAYNHVYIDNVQAIAVPEPSCALIAGAGLGGLLFRRRR